MLPETPQSGVEDDDLFPFDEEEQKKLVSEIQRLYDMAKDAKTGYDDRWLKYYKMYRSFVKKREKGEWQSRVWIPIAFFIIETITPRLVAQLPQAKAEPVGPEDVAGQEPMEELLKWASDKSDLYLELVKALKSALIYGTGIMKTSYTEEIAYHIVREPIMEEQTVDVPTGEMDMDGNPMTQTLSLGSQPVVGEDGQPQLTVVRKPFVAYAGPKAEAVDIRNFFVDPIADSIENARYVVHRVYRDRAHLEKMFNQGVYKKPPDEAWRSYLTEHASQSRLSEIGLGSGGAPNNQDKDLFELLEVWTPDSVITVAGGDVSYGILLRYERNPYMHGEMPFVRIVDHLVPHEFWGIGELEPLEGLQDVLNKMINSRIDNVLLVLNTMFMASMEYIEDPSDLVARPGKVIRVRDGMPLDQAVKTLDMGDVTGSAFAEAEEIERFTEKVSGVSQYTGGQDSSSSLNRTATGVALISEQGNTRFSHKVIIAELTGFKRLFRQYGTLIQQFAPDEIILRILGPDSGYIFKTITADAISGRFDYTVEGESSTQTESIRREQNLSLFQLLAADPYMRPLKMRSDLLKTFGKKNIHEYMYTEEELMMMMQQQQEAEAVPEEEAMQ